MRIISDRCAALDTSGRQCRREAKHVERFSGDPEMHGFPHEKHPGWVKVGLCDEHWEGPWREKRAPAPPPSPKEGT